MFLGSVNLHAELANNDFLYIDNFVLHCALSRWWEEVWNMNWPKCMWVRVATKWSVRNERVLRQPRQTLYVLHVVLNWSEISRICFGISGGVLYTWRQQMNNQRPLWWAFSRFLSELISNSYYAQRIWSVFPDIHKVSMYTSIKAMRVSYVYRVVSIENEAI